DSSIQVSTLITPIRNYEDVFDPNVTKTVASHNGFALYFSRSPIPFRSDQRRKFSSKENITTSNSRDILAFKHLGLYAYRKSFLMQFSKLPKSPLEETEKLEQLRILDNGIPIKVIETQDDSIGVDSPKDMKKVQRFLNEPVTG
ncbi:MAG: 3-deoxy-manno-octulosonate cytidylyltransferase, partial [Nitrospinota bacterium]|nr:3-deoxy-manno-octulosonate cytidylyltransferase [Nitrospinota bacterium]